MTHPLVRYVARARLSAWGWGALALASAVVAAIALSQAFVSAPGEPAARAGARLALDAGSLGAAAASVAAWLVLAAGVFRLALRLPVRGQRATRNAALLAAAGCALLVLHLAFRLLMLRVSFAATAQQYYSTVVNTALLLFLYMSVVGLVHAFDFALRYQRKANDELRLRAELAEAELQRLDSEMRSLKLELNPHFVLNALNGVSALLYVDPARARDVVVRLGDLLRRTLETSGLQQVTLEEEIGQLRPYVEIQQVRFGASLDVRWEVASDTLGVAVPHMVLQPLVENAIKHGLGGGSAPGLVRIRAWRDGPTVHLQVCDDGRGPSEAPRARGPGGGVGLSNVRSRLHRLYGAAASFHLAPGPEGGAVAHVTLPAELPARPE